MDRKTTVKKKSPKAESGSIIIDQEAGLIFSSEEELFRHFEKDIEAAERRLFEMRDENDISMETYSDYEGCLGPVLEDPERIFEDEELIPGSKVYVYYAAFETDAGKTIHYLALTRVSQDTPTFIYLHFPTVDEKLVERFTAGALIYDRSLKDVMQGAFEGDALSEGDSLAIGLYTSMLKLRTERDIPEDKFRDYAQCRDETIQEPDEIWRNPDLMGNLLVTFVREYDDPENAGESYYYVVVTVEDEPSHSHALLFSFPTTDNNLVERYRQGENLQAEEVVQEPSH